MGVLARRDSGVRKASIELVIPDAAEAQILVAAVECQTTRTVKARVPQSPLDLSRPPLTAPSRMCHGQMGGLSEIVSNERYMATLAFRNAE